MTGILGRDVSNRTIATLLSAMPGPTSHFRSVTSDNTKSSKLSPRIGPRTFCSRPISCDTAQCLNSLCLARGFPKQVWPLLELSLALNMNSSNRGTQRFTLKAFWVVLWLALEWLWAHTRPTYIHKPRTCWHTPAATCRCLKFSYLGNFDN